MDAEFITAQAEQDQQWMALDDWYGKIDTANELMDITEILDRDNGKSLIPLRKMDKHGLEIVRVLALHTLRELMLRQQQAADRAKMESE